MTINEETLVFIRNFNTWIYISFFSLFFFRVGTMKINVFEFRAHLWKRKARQDLSTYSTCPLFPYGLLSLLFLDVRFLMNFHLG